MKKAIISNFSLANGKHLLPKLKLFLLFFILGCFSVSAQSQDSAFYFSQKNAVLYIASGTIISNSQNIHVASPTDNTLYIVGNTAVILNGISNASIVHVPIRNKTTTTSKKTKQKQTVRFQLREIATTNAKVQQSATVIKTRLSKENAILKMQFSCWIVISTSHTSPQKKHTKSVTNFSQFYACSLGEKALSVASNYFIYTYNNCVQHLADYALFSRPPTIFFPTFSKTHGVETA